MKHIEIENSKIIIAIGNDSIYLTYNIDTNKKLIFENQLSSLYFLENENCYLLLNNSRVFINEFKDYIYPLINEFLIKNKIHILLSAESGDELSEIIKFINKSYQNCSIKYSIIMIAGEVYSESFLKNIDDTLFKGVITSTYNSNIIDILSNKEKYNLNYLHTLTYFYILAGYYLGVEDVNVLTNNKRFPKIFYYSKSNECKEYFIKILEETIPNEFLYPKHYTDNMKYLSKFLPYERTVHFTTSFFDYTTCMFNLTFESSIYNGYMTEKTFKAIISNTPTFLVINDDVYNSLKEYGFYFLNDEFKGNDIMETYLNFIEYFKKCNEIEIRNLYERTSTLSMNNRKLLYQYIHSYKDKELEYFLEI
jgi:hypothetical protein